MSDEDNIRTEFEQRGLARVRDSLARGEFNLHYRALAVDWVAEKDGARETQQLRLMRSSARAAWAAAIAAFAAVVATVIIGLLQYF